MRIMRKPVFMFLFMAVAIIKLVYSTNDSMSASDESANSTQESPHYDKSELNENDKDQEKFYITKNLEDAAEEDNFSFEGETITSRSDEGTTGAKKKSGKRKFGSEKKTNNSDQSGKNDKSIYEIHKTNVIDKFIPFHFESILIKNAVSEVNGIYTLTYILEKKEKIYYYRQKLNPEYEIYFGTEATWYIVKQARLNNYDYLYECKTSSDEFLLPKSGWKTCKTFDERYTLNLPQITVNTVESNFSNVKYSEYKPDIKPTATDQYQQTRLMEKNLKNGKKNLKNDKKNH